LRPDIPQDSEDPSDAQYFLWAPAGKAVRAYLSHTIIRELRSRLRDMTEDDPEFGGLLLGRVGPGHEGTFTVVIDQFAPVESEHRYGPALALSARDLERLNRQLERLPQHAVGFFRSHVRRGLYLDQRDFELFRSCFPEPSSVFLVARQSDPEHTAGFFIWEESDIERRSPYQEFSLEQAGPSAADEIVTGSTPAAAVRQFQYRWLAMAAIAACVTLLPLAFYKVMRPLVTRQAPAAASPPSRPLLAMQARQNGNLLELTWDPNDPQVGKADHARLFITDGEDREDQWLERAELTSGKFIYQPSTSKVEFRLELYSRLQRQELSAAVQNIEMSAPAAEEVKPETRPRPRRTRPASASRSVNPQREAVAPAVTEKLVTIQAPLREPAPATPQSNVVEPRPEPSREPVTPAEPPKPKPAPVSRVSFTLHPVPPSRVRQTIQKVPGLRALQRSMYKAGERFVPARPLETALPVVPANLRIDREQSVDVITSIDKAGAIIDVSYAAAADRTLAKLAADAVGRWRFAPALLNSSPVSSKLILHFRFTATSTETSR
jgi:Gram-negative bacterial TonB protein C-terminal